MGLGGGCSADGEETGKRTDKHCLRSFLVSGLAVNRRQLAVNRERFGRTERRMRSNDGDQQ